MIPFRGIVRRLFEAVNPLNRSQRRYVGRHDHDAKEQINSYTRVEALSLARWAYENEGFTRGAVDSFADFSIGDGIKPQSITSDESWNKQAEAVFEDASKTIDFYGQHTLTELLSNWSKAIDIDGDVGIVLINSTIPQVQTIEAHRIGGTDTNNPRFWDGVYMDPFGRHEAYRIFSDDSGVERAIRVSDMILLGKFRRQPHHHLDL